MPTFLRGPWDVLLAHTTVLLAAAAEDLQAAQAGADDAAAADVAALERLVLRGALLLHLLPALLLSATPADVDDGILRRHRFAQVLAGDLAAVLAATLPLPAASAEAAARRAAAGAASVSGPESGGQPPAPPDAAPSLRPTKAAALCALARTPGGLRQVSRRLQGAPPLSATPAVLQGLRAKHPSEDRTEIAAALAGARAAHAAFAAGAELPAAQLQAEDAVPAAAAQAAASAARAAGEASGASPAAVHLAALAAAALGAPSLPPQLEPHLPLPPLGDLFSARRFELAIRSADPGKKPGPDGLRYCHLQAALHGGGRALAPLSRLANLLFKAPALLPAPFWRLHAAARLIALGEPAKVRPVAIGGTLRRLIGKVFVQAHASHFEALFADVGQHGVGAPAGSETVALVARLLHEGDSWVLAVDGSNAFNSVKRTAVLPAAASLLDIGFDYVAALYGGPPPELLVQLPAGAGVTIIPSATGVQQGDALGPLLFCLALLPALRALRARWGPSGITFAALMDDVFIGGQPGALVAKPELLAAFEDLRGRLAAIGIAVNVRKSQALPPQRLLAADAVSELAAAAELLLAANIPVEAALTGGMVVVGVGVGRPDFVQSHLAAKLRDGAFLRFLQLLPLLPERQVAAALLRFCAAPTANSFARTAAPAVALPELRAFDALVAWSWAAVMDVPGHPLPPFAAFSADPVARQVLPQLSLEQLRLPSRHGGLGLTAAAHISEAAFVGAAATTLPRAVSTLPPQVRALLLASPRFDSSLFILHLRGALARLVTAAAAAARTAGTAATAAAAGTAAAAPGDEAAAAAAAAAAALDPPLPAAGAAAPAAAAEAALLAAAESDIARLCPPGWAAWACAAEASAASSARPSTAGDAAAALAAPAPPPAAEGLLGPGFSAGPVRGVQQRLGRFCASLRLLLLLHCNLAASLPPAPAAPDVAATAAATAARVSRARLLSQAAPGAMLWTGTVGGLFGTSLRSDVYRLSALRAVGLQDGAPADGFCSFSNCQRARRPLTPLHRRLCGNFHVSRHNFVVKQLAEILTEAAVGPVSAEDGSPFHSIVAGSAPGQRQRAEPSGRGDLVVRHSTALSTGDATLDSRHWILDVCFGDPAATSALANLHSWHTAGWVAACLESYKHQKYRTPGTPQSATQARLAALAAAPPPARTLRPVGPAAAAAAAAAPAPAAASAVWAAEDCLYLHESFVLVPFAVETHGRLGASALHLLRALAVHASGGPNGNAAERRRLFQRWRLLLSHTVTRAVSVQAVSHPGPLLSSAEACSRAAARLLGAGGVAAAAAAASGSASAAGGPFLAAAPAAGLPAGPLPASGVGRRAGLLAAAALADAAAAAVVPPSVGLAARATGSAPGGVPGAGLPPAGAGGAGEMILARSLLW
jgi:hypothetical protein